MKKQMNNSNINILGFKDKILKYPNLNFNFNHNDLYVYGLKLSEFEHDWLCFENDELIKEIINLINEYFTYTDITNILTIKHHSKYLITKYYDGVIFINCKLKDKK